MHQGIRVIGCNSWRPSYDTKDYRYTGDGTLMIKVRVPNIHGPFRQTDYQGKQIRNYVNDSDLPYYVSLLLPHLPSDGEVVAMVSTNSGNNDFLVLGITGGNYYSGLTNLGE